MTVQPKPLASLSSGLLARKGQARPAMRPQGFSNMVHASQPADDLGWNDMGAVEPVAAMPAPEPQVLIERRALKEEIEVPPAAVRSVSVATATRLGRESAKQTKGGKAAFTLRLDAERHLRLRLASAVTNRSAQQLVAGALDVFLQTLPEVEALVAQLPPPKSKRQKD